MKFIQATQRGGNRIGLLYRVTNGNYFSMANWMDQKLVNCAPNREETEYMGYIPATIGGKQNPVMRLLAVLEIFGLASYEVRGGQNLEIFVRVNDPQKIRSRRAVCVNRRGRAAQNAHSPFSKIVTFSPRFVMPVTWVSAAPIMTSSWMADWFMPRSSSSSLERRVPSAVVPG